MATFIRKVWNRCHQALNSDKLADHLLSMVPGRRAVPGTVCDRWPNIFATALGCRFRIAQLSGVRPLLSAIPGSVSALSRRTCTAPWRPIAAAHESGVRPSLSAKLGSTLARSKRSLVSVLAQIFSAAHESGDRPSLSVKLGSTSARSRRSRTDCSKPFAAAHERVGSAIFVGQSGVNIGSL